MKDFFESLIIEIDLEALLITIIDGFLYGLLVWPCWNLVMPIFGLSKITYLGASCLVILIRLLLVSHNKLNIKQ